MIKVDSVSCKNKCLDEIEYYGFYEIPYRGIIIVVHPESIIHSMVEFVDGSLKMQAGLPSMHLPIQHAISYPVRLNTTGTGLVRELRWPDVARLNFESLDITRFPCFRLAMEAAKRGGTYPCVLVGADEEAVALFLEGEIGLLDIAQMIESLVES